MKSQIHMLPFLLCAACGPAGISSSSSESDVSSSTTESETGEPSSLDTSDGTDTSDTGMVTFVPVIDIPPTSHCDPFAQDCPVGEKCVPYSTTNGNWDANKCVPVMGEQAPGEACVYAGRSESTDDCDATSFCWGVEEVDGEMLGTCHSFCTGAADMPECPEGFFCPIASDGTINLCFPTCDPVVQDCQDGFGCYWTNASFSCVFTAEPGIADGQPCGFINDCLPGGFCAAGEYIPECEGSACCTPFCDLQLGDAQCESVPGTICSSFFEQGMAPPDYDHVGVCVFQP